MQSKLTNRARRAHLPVGLAGISIMSTSTRFATWICGAFTCAWGAASAGAHPGVQHEIERLGQEIAAQPERADLLIERAFQLRLAGAHDDALRDLDHAEKIDPANRQIAFHRGITFAEMNQPERAEQELTRYLEAAPDSVAALAERGRLRERAGRVDAALADYTAAIALGPEVELYLWRGALQESSGRLDEAAAGYRAGLAQLPDAVSIRQALIRVEIARGQFDAALALIDEAMASAPARCPWRVQRAAVLDAAGRGAEATQERLAALAELDAALARRPSAIHLVTHGEINLTLGRIAEARNDVRLALEKAPHYHAARELQEKLNALAADE